MLGGGDSREVEVKVPFLKAKDLWKEWEETKGDYARGKGKNLGTVVTTGDGILRRILASLAKGRADDQRSVARIGEEILLMGLYGPKKKSNEQTG